jgi:hypothetical protein
VIVDKQGNPLILDRNGFRRFIVDDLIKMGEKGFDTSLSFKWTGRRPMAKKKKKKKTGY